MPSVYFLSYARPRMGTDSTTVLVDRFATDLSDEVGSLVQADGARVPVGFRDTGSIEAGTADWSEELSRQMQRHPVGIVLVSPAYLERDRPWCKWECLFLAARNAVVDGLPDGPVRNKPRLLLPINWVKPDPRDLPEHDFPGSTQEVGDSIVKLDPLRQSSVEDLAAVRFVSSRGLRATLMLLNDGDDESRRWYRRYVQLFAAYVVAQWRRWQLLDARHFDLGIPPPFDPEDVWQPARPVSAAEPAPPRDDKSERRKVFVVYLAACPQEVPLARMWRYADDGEYDWKPFGMSPDADPGPLVGDAVKALERIKVNVKEWPFEYFRNNLDKALTLAGSRFPVLIIVDPWSTATLERYGSALREFVEAEKRSSVFALPVVIWNDHDADSQAIRADFGARLSTLFDRNRWQRVKEPKLLEACLIDNVKLLQVNIRNAAADGLSSSGPALPRISATV